MTIGERWLPGHISAVNPDGTYDIEYEDGPGGTETGVEADAIWHVETGMAELAMEMGIEAAFAVGDEVQASLESRWDPGLECEDLVSISEQMVMCWAQSYDEEAHSSKRLDVRVTMADG